MKLLVSVVLSLIYAFYSVDCWSPWHQPGVESCEDISPICYANLHHCSSNSFVQQRCRKSCNLCGVESCEDISPICYANLHLCSSNSFVQQRCRKSCNLCGVESCEDISPICYANLHLCSLNSFVQQRCRKSCNLCASWRDDTKCANGQHYYQAPNGKPAECNPNGNSPCCSEWGWCGSSKLHCECDKCHDYRGKKRNQHCGVKPTSAKWGANGRVYGGKYSDLHEWPWQVRLHGSDRYCGGTLISQKWVITAAHCFDFIWYRKDLWAGYYTASLGEHDTTTGSETPHTKHVPIKRVIINDNYNQDTVDNDIALLELGPYTSNPAIHPVCLPTENTGSTFTGETATVTGWGVTSFGTVSAILQEVDLQIIANSKCSNDYASTRHTVTDNMMCAYTPGKDACEGDSGGPLVWANPAGNYVLVGVVSWGEGCPSHYPGVYTRVTQYLPWIKNITGETFIGS